MIEKIIASDSIPGNKPETQDGIYTLKQTVHSADGVLYNVEVKVEWFDRANKKRSRTLKYIKCN
jgi:hypothetical protein